LAATDKRDGSYRVPAVYRVRPGRHDEQDDADSAGNDRRDAASEQPSIRGHDRWLCTYACAKTSVTSERALNVGFGNNSQPDMPGCVVANGRQHVLRLGADAGGRYFALRTIVGSVRAASAWFTSA